MKHTTDTPRGLPAQKGDVVIVDLSLTPEDGFVPHPLFDTSGVVSFVLGWGNYLPGLHSLLVGMKTGDAVSDVSIDAGWGRHDPDLVVLVPKKKLRASHADVKVGAELTLNGWMRVTVTEETKDNFVVDANPPLAGSRYTCALRVLDVHPPPSSFEYMGETSVPESIEETSDTDIFLQRIDPIERAHPMKMGQHESKENQYEVASFALGCFWGGELAFMRTPGVVGTKVGYTQGFIPNPTYKEVCNGTTKHCEAILVIYNPAVISYNNLVDVALERLKSISPHYMINQIYQEPDGADSQYRHGIFYHNEEQRLIAQSILQHKIADNKIELRVASRFYWAEEEHQSYLLKGGQSARKGAKEPIRCFG